MAVPLIDSLASLQTINLSQLQMKNPGEIARLYTACVEEGFFFLNLEDTVILQSYDKVLSLAKRYFSQSLETKLLDDVSNDTFGYKPFGTLAGVKIGSRDRYEALKITPTHLLEDGVEISPIVKDDARLLSLFASACHSVTKLIMSCISDALGLTGVDRLEKAHLDHRKGRTNLSLLHYPRNFTSDDGLGHNMHTDVGSITLLMTRQWGLQVLSPQTGQWRYVQPRPEHAIINIGDSVRLLSGGRLSSAIHRVLPFSGRQDEDRYSVAYFLRPDDDVMFQDPQGEMTNARTWFEKKFKVFRETHGQQEDQLFLTGGMQIKQLS